MAIVLEITCKCGHPFKSSEAEFCEGCFVKHCGCRGVDDPCSCQYYKTLKCPSCGVCVCNRVTKWKAEGKLVFVDDDRFEFVHKDYLKEST